MPEIDLGPIIGPQGPQGATGPAGATGPGVPAGGTAGQIVTKKSSTGFDTEWRSPVNDANQTEAGYVLDARMGKTLNDQFIYTDGSYTFSSQEALNTLIETLATGNGSYKETKYKLTCGATFGLFTNGYVYCADITRGGSTYYINVEMTPIDDGTIKIVGNKRNTTWSWDRIALNSEIENDYKLHPLRYFGAICKTESTSSGTVFSYFSNLEEGAYFIILRRMNYTWNNSVSIYIMAHGSVDYAKQTIVEGTSNMCPKLDENNHIYLSSVSDYPITIELLKLS